MGLMDKSNLKVYMNDTLVIDSDKHINDFKEPIKRFNLDKQYIYIPMKDKIKILKLKQNKVDEKDLKAKDIITTEDVIYSENQKFEKYSKNSSSLLVIKQ